jgi:hypothetical protein
MTALGLTACVLLVALWVRSYWWADIFVSNRWNPIVIVTHGEVFYGADYSYAWGRDIKEPRVIRHSDYWYQLQKIWNADGRRVSINKSEKRIPIWPFVLVSVAVATAPWIKSLRPRFSLRTLLIATTLIAVGLGIVFASS